MLNVIEEDKTVTISGTRPHMDHVYWLIKCIPTVVSPEVAEKTLDNEVELIIRCNTFKQAHTFADIGEYARRLARD